MRRWRAKEEKKILFLSSAFDELGQIGVGESYFVHSGLEGGVQLNQRLPVLRVVVHALAL
jgi:hypothetical protein